MVGTGPAGGDIYRVQVGGSVGENVVVGSNNIITTIYQAPVVSSKVSTSPLHVVPSRLGRLGRGGGAAVALIVVTAVSCQLNGSARATPPTATRAPSESISPVTVPCVKTRMKTVQIISIPQRIAVYAVAFSPDRNTLATGSENTELRDVTDPARPGAPVLADKIGSISALAYSPDGHTMATANTNPRPLITLWNVDDPRHPIRLATRPGPANQVIHSIAFSRDGNTMATADSAAGVVLWNVSNRAHPAITKTFVDTTINPRTGREEPVAMYAVAFNSAQQPMLAAGGADDKITIYELVNLSQPTVVATIPSPNWVYALAFSRDGNTLVSGGRSSVVQVWDMTNPSIPRTGATLDAPEGGVQAFAISPDQHFLAAADLNSTARLWSIRDPRNPVCIETVHTRDIGIVYTVAFSSDGATMATGNGDDHTTLWSVNLGG